MRQYLEYITQLKPGWAGKLTPEAGETTASVRRRLGAAAQLLRKNLVVKRQGNMIFFWEEVGGPPTASSPRQKQSGELARTGPRGDSRRMIR